MAGEGSGIVLRNRINIQKMNIPERIECLRCAKNRRCHDLAQASVFVRGTKT